MFKIGITGVGGGVGQSIIKSLIDTDYGLVTFDSDKLGTGLYMNDNSHVIPEAKSNLYIDTLFDICRREKINLLFPGLDAELMPLALNKEKFKEIGTRVIVSDPNVINISNDKLLTYKSLNSLNINIPETIETNLLTPDSLCYPFIIKPRHEGCRSKNVYMISNKKDWVNFLHNHEKNISSFISMEYIDGDEYTCGTVNISYCRGVIIMRRILRNGDTYKCFVENNEIIHSCVELLMNKLLPFGACNVQLKYKNKIPWIFEINARCSGTTASRSMCGFNEPLLISDYLLKNKDISFEIIPKTILRYLNEIEV